MSLQQQEINLKNLNDSIVAMRDNNPNDPALVGLRLFRDTLVVIYANAPNNGTNWYPSV